MRAAVAIMKTNEGTDELETGPGLALDWEPGLGTRTGNPDHHTERLAGP